MNFRITKRDSTTTARIKLLWLFPFLAGLALCLLLWRLICWTWEDWEWWGMPVVFVLIPFVRVCRGICVAWRLLWEHTALAWNHRPTDE